MMIFDIILGLIIYFFMGFCTGIVYEMVVEDEFRCQCPTRLAVIFWPLFYLGLLVGAIAALIDSNKRR